jgi:ComF family protein
MPTKPIKFFLNQIVNSFTPNRCCFCQSRHPQTGIACQACLEDLPWQMGGCQQCALPLPIAPTSDSALICGECLHKPPPFTHTSAAFRYLPPISDQITRFKHQRDLVAGRFLSAQLAQQLRLDYEYQAWPDVITAVPLHWQRQLWRGFNQAAYISRQLNLELKIPLLHCCCRKAATVKQQQLSRKQRLKNLRHSFEIISDVSGLHLALIDDVMTTGTTARELSSILLQAGAKRVDLWVLARTPTPGT